MTSNPNVEAVPATEAALSSPLDPHDVSLIAQNLRLTPEERLEQLVRVVSFIQAAREAVARARG